MRHSCASARTALTTFIFMGGDACHHCGGFQPTEYLPLPQSSFPSPLANPPLLPGTTCPGSLLQIMHLKKSATESFYVPKDGLALLQDYPETLRTIEKLTEFDANDNVLTIIGHEGSLLNIQEFFPTAANNERERLGGGLDLALLAGF